MAGATAGSGARSATAPWRDVVGRVEYSATRGADDREVLTRAGSSARATERWVVGLGRAYSAGRGVGACAALGGGYSAQPTPSARPERYSVRAARSQSSLDTYARSRDHALLSRFTYSRHSAEAPVATIAVIIVVVISPTAVFMTGPPLPGVRTPCAQYTKTGSSNGYAIPSRLKN